MEKGGFGQCPDNVSFLLFYPAVYLNPANAQSMTGWEALYYDTGFIIKK